MSSRWKGTEGAISERWLGRWMIGVAVVYLLLFANLAWLKLDPSRLETFYPTYDTTTSVAAQTTIDALLMFGLKLAVIAIVFLWASRDLLEHRVLPSRHSVARKWCHKVTEHYMRLSASVKE